MKKNIFNILFLMLLPMSFVFGQNASTPVKFTETSWNFGKINETAGLVSHTFEFVNTSNAPYIIEFISVSCGCTTPEYSKAPVLPGKKGSIKITYDPKDRPGVFNRTVVVTANNRRSQIQLTILGEVIGKPRTPEDDYPVNVGEGIRATSNTFLFGYIPRGKTKTQVVNIFNNGIKEAKISAVARAANNASSIVRVNVDPEIIRPKEKGYMTITYDITDADVWGIMSTPITLNVNGKPTSTEFTAYATVTEDFSDMSKEEINNAAKATLSSQFYHFGDVKRGDKMMREFKITNTGENRLIIRNIKPNSDRITYTIDKTELDSGESANLTVNMKSDNLSGRLSESVTIILNDPSRPMREIRVAANVN